MVIEKEIEGVDWSGLMQLVLQDLNIVLRACHWNFVVIPADQSLP